ncbi:MAG: cupin domain-containing protein [Desulfurivibrionaceae bacterium]
MTKSTATYWNALSPENRERWTPIKGMEGMAEELTFSIDQVTGEYTRLTRFLPGADTTAFDGKTHPYPEEVFIVSGRLYDKAFNVYLESGHYASRPPGELHGPFKTNIGCVVLEISFPNRIADNNVAQPITP